MDKKITISLLFINEMLKIIIYIEVVIQEYIGEQETAFL